MKNLIQKNIGVLPKKDGMGTIQHANKCDFSHEGINGTYCNQLKRYVEYGKGDCGK